MSEDLAFNVLPKYAAHLSEFMLDDFVRDQIKISISVDLPLLRHLSFLKEEELVITSTVTTKEFLDYLAENRASDFVHNSIKTWVADQLPQNLSRYQLSADDLTLISYIRKQSLIKFLPTYTTDLNEALEIIKEIDKFTLKSDALAFETYMQLTDEKINEHLHFIEKIAETAPGIVYVYDLVEGKQIYSNKKTEELIGYHKDDFVGPEKISWQELQHPDDIIATAENLKELEQLQDGEVKVYEHRLKAKDEGYRWFREYQTIFKKDASGKAIQVIGLAMNIDAEKAMADELVNREEQLLEAQALAEMGSFNWNLVGEVSATTPQLKKILGLNGNIKFDEFMQRIHPYDKRQVETALNEALNNGGIYDAEFRYSAPGSEREQILWSRGVVNFQHGKPSYMKGTIMDVTERHHMIQRLTRSEQLYKQAQALTHIGNWTWDLKHNKITWTDELYRIFNLDPQSVEIKLNELLTFVHPKDQELVFSSISNVDKLLPGAEYFPRVVLKDGTIKILSVKTELIKDEQGNPFKLIGTAQDITVQKTNEKKLRENQNFIQKITDATPSVIAAYNIHTGKYTFINRAFEKILGYTIEKVVNEGTAFLSTIIHPDDIEKITTQNSIALANANRPDNIAGTNDLVVDFVYRMRHSNGTYRWFHTYGTIFDRNEKKEVEHVLNISIDITDRVAAEEKVKEQEHFIQQIADASPTVLFLYDVEKDAIIYINKEIEPVLGYTPQEILGMGSAVKAALFHSDDHHKLGFDHGLQNGLAFKEYECGMKERNGGWRCMLIREIGFKENEKREYTQVLCAALDISDRKQIEDSLYHKTLELQQSNSSLEEFAYVASHDLKEPLRKITTFGDRLLAKEKECLNEDSRMYLNKIIESSQRMQRMIDDLLSISMISGEKTFEKFDLQVILNEVIQTLEFKIEDSKATIQADDLPVANIIPSQFRQLFQNLISNSLKFAKAGVSPVIVINQVSIKSAEIARLQLNPSTKYIAINFKDNGIGFDEKFAEKIFSIFHRLHGKSEYEGTGIGLSICKKIVENHNGRIFATSKENQGANFTVVIPA